jgi:thymidylate synthase
LNERGVAIWNDNTRRETLDKLGLTSYEEGDAGPIYGFQWRHFGAKYQNCHTDYASQGVDQLERVIHQLKTDPHSRRMLVCAWNPVDVHEASLPPCHFYFQLYVTGSKELSLKAGMRSCDCALGLPFNIGSYAIMCKALAHITEMSPKELIMDLGDSHIYLNHIPTVYEIQTKRRPFSFPKLVISDKKQRDLREFVLEDLQLLNYQHHPAIKIGQMAI